VPPASEEGVEAVYVTPVMDDAWAAVSSEQTLTFDDAPLLAAPVAVLALALVPAPALPAAAGVDVLDATADVLDTLEHAAADKVTSTRLAAVNAVGNRMTSPRLGRSRALALLQGDQAAVTSW
jgi:hypothetical protein